MKKSNMQNYIYRRGYGAVAEYMLSVHKAWGSTPSTSMFDDNKEKKRFIKQLHLQIRD